MTGNDFELHRALEEVAPAAVRTLVQVAEAADVTPEMRSEALERLRQIRASVLVDAIPLSLRRRVDGLLDEAPRPG